MGGLCLIQQFMALIIKTKNNNYKTKILNINKVTSNTFQMKRLGILAIFAMMLLHQVQSQGALIPAGAMGSGETIGVAWTLGELATRTLKSGQTILTQGIIQPLITITNTETIQDPGFSISVYPNPTSRELFIETSVLLATPFNGYIYSTEGKLMKSFQLAMETTSINLSNLGNGFYIVKLFNDKNEPVKTYNIIKQ